MTTIYTSLGMKRYVGGTITETTGKDISGATFQIGTATDNVTPPTIWTTPDVSLPVTGNTAQWNVLKLIDSTVTPVGGWVWAKISDSPEVEPLPLQQYTTA